MRITVTKTNDEDKLCYRMRYNVMCHELGWLSTDMASPEEKDAYDDGQSINFLALDDNNYPIGTTRLIVDGNIPLPIEKHFKIESRQQMANAHGKITLAAEGSRFIVQHNSGYRHHEVSVAMCHSIIKKSLELDISHVFVSADHKVFRLLRMIGFPLVRIGEPVFYMGSKTVPSIVSIKECEHILEKSKTQTNLHGG